ncbi:MAG TPA: TonB family protein [Terriglobales bacterium]|nr:TonB family protein [Terriglobales bacterium]
MFAESLLESGSTRHPGRGWATTLSITVQALLLAALGALPVFRPDVLPTQVKTISSPVAFGSEEPKPSPPTAQRPAAPNNSQQLPFKPQTIPKLSFTTNSSPVPPGPYTPAPGPVGSPDGNPNALNSVIPINPPIVKVAQPVRVSISTLDPGQLLSRVQPKYPPIAVQTRKEGVVVLRAVIDREGRIASVQVVSGHPFFLEAAKSAVERWRYRPYLLNGQAVEVETQITVNFRFER